MDSSILMTLAVGFLIGNAASCPMTRRIVFSPALGATCANLTGATRLSDGYCAFETCADLLDHSDRWYCGVGHCDAVGDDCDGGCIQLDSWSRKIVSRREKRRLTTTLKDLFRIKYQDIVSSPASISMPYMSIWGSQDLELSSKVPIED